MKPVITVTDAVRNFADFINRVVYRREEFVLERGGRRVAQLVPVPEGRRLGELPASTTTQSARFLKSRSWLISRS